MKFNSYIKEINKELEKVERRQRGKAVKLLKNKLKQKATERFGSGSNITKGIGHISDKYESRVGVGPKAYHAHLIEFGTDTRFTTKGIGSGEKGTGHIQAEPFVFPTFEENTQAVINIMQEVWF